MTDQDDQNELEPLVENEYDIRNASIDEFIDFLSVLISASNIKPKFDPVGLVRLYIQLFSKPEVLGERFSTEQIDRVFLLIGSSYDPENLPNLIKNAALPLL